MSENLRIEILFEPTEENPFVIIKKPHNLPSAPLTYEDTYNALYQAAEYFPEILNVKGRKEVERGLIHRLDTVTEGILLVALKQDFYDKMLEIQSSDKFIKYYRADCNICKDNVSTLGGFPPSVIEPEALKCNDIVCTKSYFRSYGIGGKEVRPVTQDSNQAALKKLKSMNEYMTEIHIKDFSKEKVSVICKISRGYRHQVRCHLAWAGIPCENDPLYNSLFMNSTGKKSENIKFEAVGFEFIHPYSDKDCNKAEKFSFGIIK